MTKPITTFLIVFMSLFVIATAAMSTEVADIIVAKDGTGDFSTIQEAINSIPANNSELKIILIKNGVYNEKIRIDTDFIALVGEDRDSTRIEYYEPYDGNKNYPIGRAVININANDITLANLTAENTQEDVGIHAFTIYGSSCTRTIIINCNIISNGGDTLSLWNSSTGMYYHNTLYLQGAVDFLCPRGWCYVDNIDFYCTRNTTPLWHDGSKNIDQKFVVKNSTMDGATNFTIGRNHRDGAFYLLNLNFSSKMNNVPFTLPASADGPYKWGERYYYHNCNRPAGNYDWFKDNLMTAPNSPNPDEITPAWTFANQWDPEATMHSVLPMAFLPKPDNKSIRVSLTPNLTWVPGRNAQSHSVYFGTTNPPPLVTNTTDRSYTPGQLNNNTVYYWRIDEVDGENIIEGPVWQFHTKVNHVPIKASQPSPANGAVDVESPVERLMWQSDTLSTDIHHVYLGENPDSLNLVSSYAAAGYYLMSLHLGTTYYWRVDLENHVGLTTGDVWSFTPENELFAKADFIQEDSENCIVSIEVEDYTDSTIIGDPKWELKTDPAGFSGTGVMKLLPDLGKVSNIQYLSKNSRLDYAVDFKKTGPHYLWIRAYSVDGNDDNFHMGLNLIEERTASRIGRFEATGQWEWIHRSSISTGEVRTFEVKALGIQRVSLLWAEDGCIADKIVLTTNPDYVPTGLDPDATNTSVSTESESPRQEQFQLFQNYPNPFNPSTNIRFELPAKSFVTVKVFNIAGREVATLFEGFKQAGSHNVTFDASHLSTGVYLYRVKTDKLVGVKRLLLMK